MTNFRYSRCPSLTPKLELQLVHCASYAEGDPQPQYYPNPGYDTHKISLDPYRRASERIFSIFGRFAPTLQRASVDEAFMDLTAQVNSKIAESIQDYDVNAEGPLVDWTGLGVVVGADPQEDTAFVTRGWRDLQLAIAAKMSMEIRAAVLKELGYTCSAGIAHNKTLAKLCSSFKKPANQSILRESQVLDFMKEYPFRKIRNLGGKLGAIVKNEFLEVEKAGDLWRIPLPELVSKFGDESGRFIYDIIRGNCNEPGTPYINVND